MDQVLLAEDDDVFGSPFSRIGARTMILQCRMVIGTSRFRRATLPRMSAIHSRRM
jgi:hypothetical protein